MGRTFRENCRIHCGRMSIITPPEGHGVSLPDGRVFEKIGGVYVEKLALDTQTGKWNYAARWR